MNNKTSASSKDNCSQKPTLESLLAPFTLSLSDIHDIMESIQAAFNRGLANESDNFLYHPVKMLNTHLMVVPNGSEVGRFVALDLGGTNLRILSIKIEGETLVPNSKSYEVPMFAQAGSASDLFDFIAEKIEDGLKYLGFEDVEIECMGFTFSFPCHQLALNSGKLIRWTKGYCARDVEGKDVVFLLLEACRKRGIKIHDFVLINDTTGTLLCGAYENPDSAIGVINGTGTNACYLEKISQVTKWRGPSEFDTVIINTEWGAFGENGELDQYRTLFDTIVDKDSINPGRQIFEKMVSGMYLGRLVRQVILLAAELNLIFNGQVPEFIKSHEDGFPTPYISDAYKQEVFVARLKENHGFEISKEDYQSIFKICDAVSRRSTGLMAAGLSALIVRINKENCAIAADGSLFKHHPTYRDYVKQYIDALLPKRTWSLILVDDGSGKGAALAACVAKEHIRRSRSSNEISDLIDGDDKAHGDLHSL